VEISQSGLLVSICMQLYWITLIHRLLRKNFQYIFDTYSSPNAISCSTALGHTYTSVFTYTDTSNAIYVTRSLENSELECIVSCI
jgi:hypothetical protein